MPAGGDAISSKLTISIEDKMSPDKAWQFLIKVLDIAGYTVVPRADGYEIVKTSADVSREALPIYIGIPWDQFPDTDERIRCVFYLSNIKVPTDDQSLADNELYKVLATLLPEASTSGCSGSQIEACI